MHVLPRCDASAVVHRGLTSQSMVPVRWVGVASARDIARQAALTDLQAKLADEELIEQLLAPLRAEYRCDDRRCRHTVAELIAGSVQIQGEHLETATHQGYRMVADFSVRVGCAPHAPTLEGEEPELEQHEPAGLASSDRELQALTDALVETTSWRLEDGECE